MTHLAHQARPRRRGGPVAFGARGALGVPLSTPGISVAVGATGAFRALGAPGALGALGEWRASRACRTWRAFRTWRTGRAWRMTSRGAPGARPLPPRATGGRGGSRASRRASAVGPPSGPPSRMCRFGSRTSDLAAPSRLPSGPRAGHGSETGPAARSEWRRPGGAPSLYFF